MRAQRDDHMAVLWFMAEAEGLPVRLIKEYISEMQMMESELYKSIFSKGEARGEAKGKAEGKAELLLRLLLRRSVNLDESVSTRIRAETRPEVLDVWFDDALMATSDEGLRQLQERIRHTPPPQSSVPR